MSDQPFTVVDTVRVKGAPARTPTMTVTKIATLEGGLTAWVTWYVEGEWKEHRFPAEALMQVQVGRG